MRHVTIVSLNFVGGLLRKRVNKFDNQKPRSAGCLCASLRPLHALVVNGPQDKMVLRKRIAIIGAGPAGIAAARQFVQRRQEFDCEVFERNQDVGGTWRISECVGNDEYGLEVHSSMYKNLRTNLPKEIMLYPDYAIPDESESYLTSERVLQYIEEYVDHYNIRSLIHFNHYVKRVTSLPENKWEIEIIDLVNNKTTTSEFDAVMVCNGKPKMPDIEGASEFAAGSIIHSHDYREPKPYAGQRVLVIGAGPTALDVIIELKDFAKQVIMSHHRNLDTQFPDNVFQVPDVRKLTSHEAIFIDDSRMEIDAIIYCTGYHISFPFLDASCGVKVTEKGAEPLYRHLVHIDKPTMCFLALANHVVPFPMADLQARYFVKFLEGGMKLPSAEQMRAHTAAELEKPSGSRLPHFLGPKQAEYYESLAKEANIEPLAPVISILHAESHKGILHNLFNYRQVRFKILDEHNFIKM